MFCEICGNKLDDDAVFCEICGTKIAPVKSAQAKPAPAKIVPTKPAVAKNVADSDRLVTENIEAITRSNVASNDRPVKVIKKNVDQNPPVDSYRDNTDTSKPKKPKKKKSAAPVIIILILLIIGMLVAGYFLFLVPILNGESGDEATEEDDDDDDDDDSKSSRKSKKKSGDNEAAETEMDVTITVCDANLSDDDENSLLGFATVEFKEGFDNPDGAVVASGETNNQGVYEGKLKPGNYTAVFSKSGYVVSYENIAVDSDVSVLKYLPQRGATDDVIVIVEWKGDRDIDLCFYNAFTDERICANNSKDKDESFSYRDNKNIHYEMIYLRSYQKSIVRSVYVVDPEAARNGSASQMEAEGVIISVYNKNDMIYRAEADRNHDEAVWYAFYVYQSEIHDEDAQYSGTNSAEYRWATSVK